MKDAKTVGQSTNVINLADSHRKRYSLPVNLAALTTPSP
jgi:hypothetical protein